MVRFMKMYLATITSPDGIFAFGVFNGVILTWCVMTVARKLRQWDVRNKQ